MPVNATRVTQFYAYALPGPVQSFSAKADASLSVVVTTNHQQLRHWRMYRSLLFFWGV